MRLRRIYSAKTPVVNPIPQVEMGKWLVSILESKETLVVTEVYKLLTMDLSSAHIESFCSRLERQIMLSLISGTLRSIARQVTIISVYAGTKLIFWTTTDFLWSMSYLESIILNRYSWREQYLWLARSFRVEQENCWKRKVIMIWMIAVCPCTISRRLILYTSNGRHMSIDDISETSSLL